MKKIHQSLPKKGNTLSDNNISILVIGGSAGSFNALGFLLQTLPHELQAVILIVLHVSPNSNISFLVQHLQQHTAFPCKIASEGDILMNKTIYFSAPQAHLLVSEDARVILGRSADENRFKPSIDVLFRSAAVHFRERVIGVILSGFLDDGAAGMKAIMRCGGVCIVQDPADAEYADLPLAVIGLVKKPDYTVPVSKMGEIIFKLSRLKKRKVTRVPQQLIDESQIAAKALSDIDQTRRLGSQSLFTCPDCGGSLWHIDEDGVSRYRCFTGHAYSENYLMEKQNESVLLTLWTALRIFEERKKLLQKMGSGINIKRRLKDLDEHILTLKALLSDIQKVTQ